MVSVPLERSHSSTPTTATTQNISTLLLLLLLLSLLLQSTCNSTQSSQSAPSSRPRPWAPLCPTPEPRQSQLPKKIPARSLPAPHAPACTSPTRACTAGTARVVGIISALFQTTVLPGAIPPVDARISATGSRVPYTRDPAMGRTEV